MATELERLVAVFEADTTRFDKGITNLQKLFDQRANQIEARQKTMQAKLNQGWEMPGFNRFLAKLGATVSVVGIIAGIRAIVAEADHLQDAADQLDLTTQDLQGLQAVARDTGAGPENLARGLATLTDNLGKAADGEGEFAKFLRSNDIQMGNTMQVLFDLADRVQKASSQNERMAISTMAFGRAGRELVPILARGRDGLREMLAEAQRSGQVWDPETVAQLDRASDAFARLKVKLEGDFADPFARILESLDSLVGSKSWAEFWDKFTHSGEESSFIIRPDLRPDFSGGQYGTTADLQSGFERGARGAIVGSAAGPVPNGRSDVPSSKADTSAAAAAAEKAARLEQQRQQAIAKTTAEAIAAEAELTRATNDANLARAEGTAAYYALAVKAANDDLAAELAAIAAKEAADIAALKRRELGETAYAAAVANIQREAAAKQATAQQKAQAAIDAARKPFADAVQNAEDQVRAQQQQTESVGLYGGALAEATLRRDLLNAAEKTGIPLSVEDAAKIDALAHAYGQWTEKLEAAQRAEARNVELMDDVRDGAADIGVAALHGADSFKEALGQMLVHLAELYFRLKVLEPLIESVLGANGTSGGGLFGDLFSSILGSIGGGIDLGGALTSPGPTIGAGDIPALGFAKGGRPPRGEASVVGEEGPELFVPDEAGTIVPHPESERLIRERVARADLDQPADAERVIRERVVPAPDDPRRAIEDRLAWQQSLAGKSIADVLREHVDRASRMPDLPVRKYAGGGIADRPQLAEYGEGDTPEAFVPVPSGRIPVEMRMPRLPPPPRAIAPSVNNVVNVSIPVDARGAQKGAAEIFDEKIKAVVPAIVAAATKQTDARFTANLHRAYRDDV